MLSMLILFNIGYEEVTYVYKIFQIKTSTSLAQTNDNSPSIWFITILFINSERDWAADTAYFSSLPIGFPGMVENL